MADKYLTEKPIVGPAEDDEPTDPPLILNDDIPDQDEIPTPDMLPVPIELGWQSAMAGHNDHQNKTSES